MNRKQQEQILAELEILNRQGIYIRPSRIWEVLEEAFDYDPETETWKTQLQFGFESFKIDDVEPDFDNLEWGIWFINAQNEFKWFNKALFKFAIPNDEFEDPNIDKGSRWQGELRDKK